MNFKSSRNAKISNLLMKKFNLLVEQEGDIMGADEILLIVNEARSLLGKDNARARKLQIQASQELKKGRNAGSETHTILYNEFGKSESKFDNGVAMRATNIPANIKKELTIGKTVQSFNQDNVEQNTRTFNYLVATGQLPFEDWSSFEAGFDDIRGDIVLNNLGATIGRKNKKSENIAKGVVDKKLLDQGRRGVYDQNTGRLIGVERIPVEGSRYLERGARFDVGGLGADPMLGSQTLGTYVSKFGAAGAEWPEDDLLDKVIRAGNEEGASPKVKKKAAAAKQVKAAKKAAENKRDRVGQYKDLGIDDVYSSNIILQDPDELDEKIESMDDIPENEKKALEKYARANRIKYTRLKEDFDSKTYTRDGNALIWDDAVKIYNNKARSDIATENKNIVNYYNEFYEEQVSLQRHPGSKIHGGVDMGEYGFKENEAIMGDKMTPVVDDLSRGTRLNVAATIPTNQYPHPSSFTTAGIADHRLANISQDPVPRSDVEAVREKTINYDSTETQDRITNTQADEDIKYLQSAVEDDPDWEPEWWKKRFDKEPAAPEDTGPGTDVSTRAVGLEEALVRKVVQEALKRKFGE